VSRDEAEPFEALLPWAMGIGWRAAVRSGMLHMRDDFAGVAALALVRAHAGYDKEEGEFRPFARAWVAGELRKAIKQEAEHLANEEPAADDDTDAVQPSAAAEELAGDIVDALADYFVGEELRGGPDVQLITREAHTALRQEVERLPPEDRRLVELRYWEGLTWDRIAAELGVPKRTLQYGDARIRALLRERLVSWCRVRPLRRRT
jgi:RNA polymerase sigma factor for flagellar operon FliA